MQLLRHITALLAMCGLLCACAEEPARAVDENLPEAMRAHLEDYESSWRKWGFINREGQMVIQPTFDDVRSFCDGWAAASKDGLWGYIDTRGRWRIPPRYLEAYDKSSSLLKVMGADGRYLLLSLAGDTVTTSTYASIEVLGTDGYAGRDGEQYLLSGSPTAPPTKDVIILSDTSYALKVSGGWQWHDHNGQSMALCQNCQLYDDLTFIRDGQHYRYDLDRRQLSAPYDEIYHAEGQYIGRTGEQYDLIQGTRALPIDVGTGKAVMPLGSDRLAIRVGSTWRLARPSGQLMDTRPMRMIYPFEDGVAPFSYGETWGLIDTAGIVIRSPERYLLPWRPSEGIMRYISSGGIGYEVLATGETLEGTYLDARDFTEGLAPVKPR